MIETSSLLVLDSLLLKSSYRLCFLKQKPFIFSKYYFSLSHFCKINNHARGRSNNSKEKRAIHVRGTRKPNLWWRWHILWLIPYHRIILGNSEDFNLDYLVYIVKELTPCIPFPIWSFSNILSDARESLYIRLTCPNKWIDGSKLTWPNRLTL
jgi:hypothetical protein